MEDPGLLLNYCEPASSCSSRATALRNRAAPSAFADRAPCFHALRLPLGAPGLVPPCIRHRPLPFTAGFLQGAPLRVLVPQRWPGQSGPSCHSRPPSKNLSCIASLRCLQSSNHHPNRTSLAKARGSTDNNHGHLPPARAATAQFHAMPRYSPYCKAVRGDWIHPAF